MKRDFSKPLLQLSGEPFADNATLGSVSLSLLLFANDQGVSGEDKFKRYKLAERIKDGGVQEVTAEEVALLKKLVGTHHAPHVVGPTFEALDRDFEAAE